MKLSSQKNMSGAKKIALVGIMAATVECGKLALSAIPNVEIVTLLCALYGYAFGTLGILGVFVFVCTEPLIWGFGTWVPLYFIYWPLVAALFMLLGKKKVENPLIITLTGLVLTVFFGLLSAFIDLGLFSGYYDSFFVRFGIYYMRGLPFYIAQFVTNAVLFPMLFVSLSKKLSEIKRKL